MTNIRNYIVVTAAYWGFTLTDGALRMLVLLHFHTLGYTPFELATLFLLYELMGVLTNLIGGWLGARFGVKLTLLSGLALQVFSLFLLSFLNPLWSAKLKLSNPGTFGPNPSVIFFDPLAKIAAIVLP